MIIDGGKAVQESCYLYTVGEYDDRYTMLARFVHTVVGTVAVAVLVTRHIYLL